MMEHYGIFIEPKGVMKEYLQQKKREVKKQFGWQSYVDHPAHSTLFCGRMTDEENWISILNNLQHPPLQIHCRSFRVFYNDPQCNGTDTLTMAIEGEQLHNLQLQIAGCLKPYSEIAPMTFSDEAMQRSWNNYGFPFIGNHWIPHMTIASLDPEKCNAFMQKTLKESIDFHFRCDEISVWKIDGEHHSKMKDVPLK
ncbi:2'-5' RNA ligase family protein [Rhodopirellula sp.]|nr:2'-5' RNA ligase family protein [Rhodopirellula sp.]